MMNLSPTEYANSIIAFLQNIDNENDANEFVRIALDSIENLAKKTNEHFDREPILVIISMIDKRINQ